MKQQEIKFLEERLIEAVVDLMDAAPTDEGRWPAMQQLLQHLQLYRSIIVATARLDTIAELQAHPEILER